MPLKTRPVVRTQPSFIFEVYDKLVDNNTQDQGLPTRDKMLVFTQGLPTRDKMLVFTLSAVNSRNFSNAFIATALMHIHIPIIYIQNKLVCSV